MARLTSELVLSLIDRVSGPARGVGASVDRLNRKTRSAATGMQRTNRLAASSAVSMGKAQSMALMGAARVMAPLAGGLAAKEIITQAADFESALTGIQKKAGTTAAETAAMGEEIKALASSGNLAVPIEEILAAYERGAAAGLPIDQLKEFATVSAKASDGFEMSAEAVGNAAAGFNVSLGIPIAEMEKYFDLINGLADAGIADEKDIVDFVDRSGAQLKMLGLTNGQIAAYGTAMLNLKMPAEVAARAMNTLSTKLLTPKATKKSEKAFDRLYGNADEFTELIKEDANGAILDFYKRLEGLDKFQRTEVLTDILGQGFSDEINRVVSALPELIRNLKYAAGTDWFGSLDKSYQLKLDDFWSQWQIMKNALAELAIDTGTMGMPAFKEALAGVQALIAQIGDGMDVFEKQLDIKGLMEAKQAVGELMASVSQLLTMGGEGTVIENTFRRLADLTNTVSGGIETAQEFMQAIGAIEDTTPDKGVGDAVNKVIDGVAGVSPAGQAIAGVRDVVTGRRTDEERATIKADNDRRRLMMGGGKTLEELDADRREYWRKRNQRLGDKAVPFAAGEMRLPDLTYPTSVPAGLVRQTPVPTARPERTIPVPRRRPSAAAEMAGITPIEVPLVPKTDTVRLEAEIRAIDQRLGELSSTAGQVVPGGNAAATVRAAADEMEALMQRRRELDSQLSQPVTAATPNVAAPLAAEGEAAKGVATTVAQSLMSLLSITAQPKVDPSSIRAAIGHARQLAAELQRIPGLADAAAQSTRAAGRVDYDGLHADTTHPGF